MARVGILGLPNVGKTTLFNALTGLTAPTAAHPFATTEPNIGVARVPDERLDQLAVLERSEKATHATLELLDLPALTGRGGQVAARLLGRLREVEALAAVLRAFHDDAIPDAESGTDPVAQAESLMLELTLADAEVLGRRAEKAAKEATADASLKGTADAVAAAAAHVESGSPLRAVPWSSRDVVALRDMAPLTLKPAVWVINVDEDSEDDLEAAVAAVVPPGDAVVVLAARLEEEAAQLDSAVRAEMLEGLGLGEGALPTVVRATHEALGLVSFFTTGSKETRAWTVPAGVVAVAAAGKIHSDLERGFIRAEVAPIEVVLEAGGWEAAKESGLVRVEGRDYAVAQGDVLRVRFSV